MLIIDVRSKEEYEASHVEGAVNIPAENFMRPHLPDELKHTPREEHIVVYCQSGNRASVVHDALNRLGFLHVENTVDEEQTIIRVERTT